MSRFSQGTCEWQHRSIVTRQRSAGQKRTHRTTLSRVRQAVAPRMHAMRDGKRASPIRRTTAGGRAVGHRLPSGDIPEHWLGRPLSRLETLEWPMGSRTLHVPLREVGAATLGVEPKCEDVVVHAVDFSTCARRTPYARPGDRVVARLIRRSRSGGWRISGRPRALEAPVEHSDDPGDPDCATQIDVHGPTG